MHSSDGSLGVSEESDSLWCRLPYGCHFQCPGKGSALRGESFLVAAHVGIDARLVLPILLGDRMSGRSTV